MTVQITPEQQQILIESMRDRIGKLYGLSLAYRDAFNKDAQMDCLDEKRRVELLLETVKNWGE